MSFISHSCMDMIARKQIQFSGQVGKSPIVVVTFPSCMERLFALVVFRTYKHLFKRSLRLILTTIAHFKSLITTLPIWHMLCALSFFVRADETGGYWTDNGNDNVGPSLRTKRQRP